MVVVVVPVVVVIVVVVVVALVVVLLAVVVVVAVVVVDVIDVVVLVTVVDVVVLETVVVVDEIVVVVLETVVVVVTVVLVAVVVVVVVVCSMQVKSIFVPVFSSASGHSIKTDGMVISAHFASSPAVHFIPNPEPTSPRAPLVLTIMTASAPASWPFSTFCQKLHVPRSTIKATLGRNVVESGLQASFGSEICANSFEKGGHCDGPKSTACAVS